MRYLKRFNESLKQDIIEHLSEKEGEYEQEEIENVFDILNEYDDELTGLNKVDSKLIIRLLDSQDLIDRLDVDDNIEDPFAF